MSVSEVIMAIAAFLGTFHVRQMAKTLDRLSSSVGILNSNVAIVIERTEKHDHEIDKLRDKHDNMANDVAQIKATIHKK